MHTVFDKAINILVDGHYCTLLKRESLLSPYSLVASSFFELDLKLKNRLVYFRHDRVEIEKSVSIGLPKTAIALNIDVVLGKNIVGNQELLLFLHKFGKPEGLMGMMDRSVRSIWSDKALSILADGQLSSAAKLVGLGIGFTPSGDDFLCGVLGGLDFLGLTQEFILLQGCLDANKTSLGGKSLLLGAMKHSYPLVFKNFILGLGKGKLDENIVNFGSTSGTDFTCGVCWVLKKYNKRKKNERDLCRERFVL